MPSAQPIGIFDSGVGGLSVWRHIRQQLPQEQLLYYADQGHVPYGPRPAGEILTFARQITDFLLARNAKLIVIACNTATAAALKQLRLDYPAVPFVGMEPAVKPGAQQTRTGVVAVLARAGTFQSQQYANLMERFGRGITLLEDPCLGLVEQIETGATASAATRALLADIVNPMLAAGADTFILGCTHYPFIEPLLRELVGTAVIIDPAPAVARQVERRLDELDLLAANLSGADQFFTSGDPAGLQQFLHDQLGLIANVVNARAT
ncbi:MAG: glutamate racemase [Anaerolineales bacterium]|nr:glutamate racemase [Anaerolineales bacterium]